MKKRVRFLSAVTAFVIVLTMLVQPFAFAAGDADVVIGTQLKFEEGKEPFIYEERTMMPLRAVSEALDATVYWFDAEKRVQIVNYDVLLSLQIGNGIMGKYKIENGQVSQEPESINLEVSPMIHNDSTYVPLRAIAEAFDASLSWNNSNRSVIILPSTKKQNQVSISEMSAMPDGTLCAAYGVICYDESTGLFYIRALSKDGTGTYANVSFCTPKKTSISDETDYDEYVRSYWIEQLGTENPSGMVIKFTGVTASVEGKTRAVLNKTTTGIRPLGYYDEYMKSLGMEYTPFVGLEG